LVTNTFAGYIGGSVLDRLLGHPKAASFKIKALVRSPEKARWLSNLGVDIILGSHSDIAKIKKAASKSDVVFACVCIQTKYFAIG